MREIGEMREMGVKREVIFIFLTFLINITSLTFPILLTSPSPHHSLSPCPLVPLSPSFR
jgi:hypothetical protein